MKIRRVVTLFYLLLVFIVMSGCKSIRSRNELVRVPVRVNVIDSGNGIEIVAAPVINTKRGKVHFKFDKYYIQDKYKKSIDDFIEGIEEKKGNIVLIGHADQIGSHSYNYDLSIRRAMNVYDYIRNRLGEENYIYNVVGKGKTELVYTGNDYRQNVLNRRVDMSFTEFVEEDVDDGS